jgi:hypothetical protein
MKIRNKTITRDFISNNFIFNDISSADKKIYNKDNLVEQINFWKCVLKYKYNAQPQESILIGMQRLGMDYFAVIIAAAELSLKIVVVDYNRTDKFRDLEYNDPKTKLLAPIGIFLHDLTDEEILSNPSMGAKYVFFTKHSNRAYSTVDLKGVTFDSVAYNAVLSLQPSPTDILFRVTSSGTTDVPKVIEHTHEFIFSISLRNSKLYKGTAVHVNNLNHGASASVTLLPLLTTDLVTNHLFFDCADVEVIADLVNALTPYKDDIGYISFPYPFLIDKFIEVSREKNITFSNLDLITLSYILESAKHAVRDGIFNSITSIFGSNETLGPVFLNTATKDNWNISSNSFLQNDDFYKIIISNTGMITVTVPVYNKEVTTNDYFEKSGDYYIHQGRSDMFRINGETINLSTINSLNKQNTRAYIVIDTLNHCLYLACWEDMSMEEIQTIKADIENNFEHIKVTKVAHLDKLNFYYGIKIDNELLREHFRTYNV